jgi:hypothetical protein
MSRKPISDFVYEYFTYSAKYNSNKTEVDSFKLKSKLFPCDQAPIQVNDSLFLLVEFDTINILFRYVNKNLEVIKEYQSFGDFEYLILIQKDIERQLYFFADVRGFFDNNRIVCFDGEANLVKYTHIPKDNKGVFNIFNWSNHKRPLFLQPRNKFPLNGRAYAALDLYISDDKDSLSIVKTFVATDSLRTVDLIFARYVNNGDDILINWRERSSYYNDNNDFVIDDAATAYSLLLFDAKAFEKYLTNLNEFTSSQFSIYPNPTNDLITINFQKTISGIINVVDINGKEVITEKLNLSDQIILSIYGLQPGIYFTNFISDDGKSIFQSKKIVKI